ncbi:MAG: DUF4333 domain-containing protein [Ilumatobacteraceae bacterium]
MPKSPRIVLLLAVAGAAAITSCGEDAFDPASQAERGIRDQILVELELESEVSCTDPADTVVGTTFHCHADAEDGTTYDFTATILPDEYIGTSLD